MTTLAKIINAAAREINLVAAGKSLTSSQQAEALELLQDILLFVHTKEGGESLRDWPIGDFGRQSIDRLDLTDLQLENPPINSQVIHTAEQAFTVYLPAMPSDGSRIGLIDPFGRLSTYNVTFNGNGRTIAGAASQTFTTDNESATYMYRADQGKWILISTLSDSDAMPYPAEFDIMFRIMLALDLSVRYGKDVKPASLAKMQVVRNQFMGRYAQSEDLKIPPDLSLDYLSTQTYDRGEEGSTREFNRGNTRGII